VIAENGAEYMVKGPTLTPQYPYVAANEYLAADLAASLGLPLLDYRIVDMGGDLLFASGRMPQGTFYPAIDATLFSQCENQDQIYALVVLDTWVCNIDRHEQNLLVRDVAGQRGGSPRLMLLVNDHSHCLMISHPPGQMGTQLRNKGPSSYVNRLPFIRDAVTDAAALRQAIDSAVAISASHIEHAVRSMPKSWLPSAERPLVEGFLTERRDRLRDLFERERAHFPNLSGGSL
jgi:hypothetical protein